MNYSMAGSSDNPARPDHFFPMLKEDFEHKRVYKKRVAKEFREALTTAYEAQQKKQRLQGR